MAHQARYDEVIDALTERDLTYECYCSRREIQAAPRAPHAPEGAYPGTCRNLSADERNRRRASGRPPALRLRVGGHEYTVTDLLHGSYTGVVDDFVLRRGDGVPAYNLAVVVDDAAQGVDQVVRGDDLLSSSPRQAYLGALLGYPSRSTRTSRWCSTPSGKRLAKRDGAVTLDEIGVDRERWTRIACLVGLRGDHARRDARASSTRRGCHENLGYTSPGEENSLRVGAGWYGPPVFGYFRRAMLAVLIVTAVILGSAACGSSNKSADPIKSAGRVARRHRGRLLAFQLSRPRHR